MTAGWDVLREARGSTAVHLSCAAVVRQRAGGEEVLQPQIRRSFSLFVRPVRAGQGSGCSAHSIIPLAKRACSPSHDPKAPSLRQWMLRWRSPLPASTPLPPPLGTVSSESSYTRKSRQQRRQGTPVERPPVSRRPAQRCVGRQAAAGRRDRLGGFCSLETCGTAVQRETFPCGSQRDRRLNCCTRAGTAGGEGGRRRGGVGDARSMTWRSFWAGHQAFFRHMTMAAKVGPLMGAAAADAGEAVARG